MRGSATPYYFRYFVQDQQLVLFGNTIQLTYTVFTSSFVTIGTIATLDRSDLDEALHQSDRQEDGVLARS
jgi:hypothetical protein